MVKKELGQFLTALIAVLVGVFALTQFVSNVELAIGFLSLTFGIVAIIWAYRAKASLSPGTSLREYTSYFLLSLISIVLFSIWETLITLFQWKDYLVYPKYFLVTLSYLIFAFASYKILYLGKQFGFQPQVKRMNFKKSKKEL